MRSGSRSRLAARRLACLWIALVLGVVQAGQPLNLQYVDQRTNYSPEFLSAACTDMLHAAWSRCVSLNPPDPSDNTSADVWSARPKPRVVPGRAIVLPPFPRFAVTNPMHAIADHIWAYVSIFSACVAQGSSAKEMPAPTIIFAGMRRSQLVNADVDKNITARINFDFSDLDFSKGGLASVSNVAVHHASSEMGTTQTRDGTEGPPTWGQWLLYEWAIASVPRENILFVDDLEQYDEPTCFLDGALSIDADFYGTAFRGMRINFWPPQIPHDSILVPQGARPWADFPERWKARGLAELRRGAAQSMSLSVAPRHVERGISRESLHAIQDDARLHVLVHTRQGDTRRIWRNAQEFVAALRNRTDGSVDIKVVHGLEGMSFGGQARLYNWADVVVGAHGAAMANTLFMRDGGAVVEVLKCCRERLGDARAEASRVRAWTGWLLYRTGLPLSHVECTEVDKSGNPKALPENQKHLSSAQLCSRNEHKNPTWFHVEPEGAVTATIAALDKVRRGIGRVDTQGLHLLPKGIRNSTESIAIAPDAWRWFAPVGPAWTSSAVASARAASRLEQFNHYLLAQMERMRGYWDDNKRRQDNGEPPATFDSVVAIVADGTDNSTAWHADLVPTELPVAPHIRDVLMMALSPNQARRPGKPDALTGQAENKSEAYALTLLDATRAPDWASSSAVLAFFAIAVMLALLYRLHTASLRRPLVVISSSTAGKGDRRI